MARIFLSYAEEDSPRAVQLVEQLRQADFDVWYWQDPRQRGGQFIAKIEAEINRADAFVAVLSAHFLASPWCRHEQDMALRREAALRPRDSAHPFLFIVQVKPVDYAKTGILGNYDWFNLTVPGREQQELDALLTRLRQVTTAGTAAPSPPVQALWPTFINRETELDDLLHSLTNPAGEHFWLVLAGPQMGKTWLLKELPVRLADRANQPWQVRLVDLRDEALDLRAGAGKLLARFFDTPPVEEPDEAAILQIAQQLSRLQQPWLCLLDSAELLSEDVAGRLRRYLSRIHRQLDNAGNENIRLAFVAASRRPYRRWKGITPTPRFTALKLTHFKDNVVENALRTMARRDNRTFDAGWYRANAARLRRLTEGLPALLVTYMQWIREAGYLFTPEQIESRERFDELALPYIRQTLLSIQSLLQFGGNPDTLEPRRAVLEQALLKLASYRLFTQSHLENVIETNPGLKTGLEQSHWTVDDLWEAIGNTFLMEPVDEPWRVLYPAIRRLLFRYHHATPAGQTEAHRRAGAFYQGWWNGVAAGKEQSVVLVERLWHQAEYLRLSHVDKPAQQLLRFAGNLFKGVIPPRGYSLKELLDYIEDQLNEDEELQETITGIHPDLFEELVKLAGQVRGSEI